MLYSSFVYFTVTLSVHDPFVLVCLIVVAKDSSNLTPEPVTLESPAPTTTEPLIPVSGEELGGKGLVMNYSRVLLGLSIS